MARGVVRCGLTVATALAASAPARGPVVADSELIPYAVHIDRSPKQSWPGYGFYLGNGYVLTAAHVVGRASETRPRIAVDGRDLPTRSSRRGTFETNDLTLLWVDPRLLPGRLQLRRLSLCSAPSAPGEPGDRRHPEQDRSFSGDGAAAIAARHSRAVSDCDRSTSRQQGTPARAFSTRQTGVWPEIISRRIDVVIQPSQLSPARKVGLAKYFLPRAP